MRRSSIVQGTLRCGWEYTWRSSCFKVTPEEAKNEAAVVLGNDDVRHGSQETQKCVPLMIVTQCELCPSTDTNFVVSHEHQTRYCSLQVIS